uniref:ATP synthase complex subunit 8 n=1 Tax=Euplectus karstenii TaxID=878009 RepID=A0A0M3LRH6_9COLE|nr:ATP synthase F0 subunit 8 [Euplectus karstenii]
MPQMAPMNWIFLYFLFTIIFIMMNFINYYYTMYTPTNKISFMKKYNFNWKW